MGAGEEMQEDLSSELQRPLVKCLELEIMKFQIKKMDNWSYSGTDLRIDLQMGRIGNWASQNKNMIQGLIKGLCDIILLNVVK